MPKEKEFERFTRIVLDEFRRVHERFDAMDERFVAVESRLDAIESRLSNIETELRDIHRRLDVLEEAARNYSGFTKEIDHLLKRVSAVEKHLGLQHNIKA